MRIFFPTRDGALVEKCLWISETAFIFDDYRVTSATRENNTTYSITRPVYRAPFGIADSFVVAFGYYVAGYRTAAPVIP